MYLYYKSSGLVVAAAETSHSHLFPGLLLRFAARGWSWWLPSLTALRLPLK